VSESEHREHVSIRRAGSVRAVLVPLTLFVLAALFWPNWWRFTSPVPAATPVPAWATNIATIRRPTLRPEIRLGAFTYRCGECHDLFPSPPAPTRPLRQHREIALKHGINDNCLNCHNRQDRDVYVDNEGRPIPTDQPQLLCAKCHGPVYRDWTHGVHGRTNGYWNTEMGPLVRRKCVECHDPHVPPFPPMRPAPGPNTLRMGDQQPSLPHTEGPTNPLLIYHQFPPGDAEHSAISRRAPADPRLSGEGK
jgi:hypothetical protein